MKIDVKKQSEKELVLEIKNTSTAFVNAVRRLAMNSVPAFAIDKIVVYENTSSFFDEYIAHRIGLIPIKTPGGHKEGEEVLFTLEGTGAEMIYSKKLKSSDEEVKVANEEIPIVQLREGQRLRIEGKARIGTGKDHAKFQTCVAAYEADGDIYKFTVESFQQMSAREVLSRTADVLVGKCEEIEKGLEDIEKKEKE